MVDTFIGGIFAGENTRSHVFVLFGVAVGGDHGSALDAFHGAAVITFVGHGNTVGNSGSISTGGVGELVEHHNDFGAFFDAVVGHNIKFVAADIVNAADFDGVQTGSGFCFGFEVVFYNVKFNYAAVFGSPGIPAVYE